MTPATPEQNCALLVDADAATGVLVRAALEDTPLSLVEAKSVAEAFDQMEREVPRLVLSELALPDGSGFAVCRRVRESATLADVPVVLLSEWSHESDRILAFECGADDFVALAHRAMLREADEISGLPPPLSE